MGYSLLTNITEHMKFNSFSFWIPQSTMETLEWLYDFPVKDNKTFFLGDHFQDEFYVTQNIIKI